MVELKLIELYTYKNESIDIRHQLVSISIFEDVFSNSIYGSVTVNDSIGLLENLPMIGEEKIKLRYVTPTMVKDIEFTGYCYKVSDLLEYNDRARQFTIHFTSFEAIIDVNKRISKYFGGKVSETVKDILFDKQLLGSDKKINIEETANSLKFVSPFWSPFRLLNHCANVALSKNGSAANYLFYETLRGDMNFVSMNSRFDPANKPVIDYIYSQENVRSEDPNGSSRSLDESYKRIINYNIDTAFDYIKRAKDGVYGSRLITANSLSKTIKVTSTDYLKDFGKTNHLGTAPVSSPDLIRSKSARLVHCVNPEYNFSGQRNTKFNEWLLQRQSLLSQIENVFKIDITVMGRTDIHAGDIVSITIPVVQPVNKGETTTDGANKFYSGRYMITAIHHHIEGRKHTMVMQCITDSLSKGL